jgi:DegV family protein with EDD domain
MPCGIPRVLSRRCWGRDIVGDGISERNVRDPMVVRRMDRRRSRVVASTATERMGPATRPGAAAVRGGELGDHLGARRSQGSVDVIGLVTDSNAQLPVELVERYGIEVVPLGIVVDGKLRLEGVDLDVTDFYARLLAGATVSTSAPAPGAFIEAYEAVAARGAAEILSVHVGADLSVTYMSARIATGSSPVPVELVDTKTASFAVGCCVWEAAEQLAEGATLDQAAIAAREVSARIGNVFVVNGLERARTGGRLGFGVDETVGLPVLALEGGAMQQAGRAADMDEAIDIMAAYVTDRVGHSSVRIGIGDAQVPDIAASLAQRLTSLRPAAEIVRYTVGPSVGCHTGPGTVGAVFYQR